MKHITPCGWNGWCLHNEKTKMVALSTASFEWRCLCWDLEETSSIYNIQLFQMFGVWSFPYQIESWLWYWAALCMHLYTGSSGTWRTWSSSSWTTLALHLIQLLKVSRSIIPTVWEFLMYEMLPSSSSASSSTSSTTAPMSSILVILEFSLEVDGSSKCESYNFQV